ncbi:MAG: hypothetical protein RI903_1110 [Bacteroidota bacterium]
MFTFDPMIVGCIRFLFALLLFSSLLLGCGSDEIVQQKNTYYSWESYLNTEIAYVIKQGNRLQKSVILDGEKEEKVLLDVDWKKEWALFLEADLNKAAYQSAYDHFSEPGMIWYSLKPGENLSVKKFVLHLDAEERPVKVEIEVEQKNLLFETHKKLFMNFSEGHVETYYIEGSQQMTWTKPTEYKLMGVLLPK